jgi:predicted helicase
MRQNLTISFSDIRVIDLHGSIKKRDDTTFAQRDENVFDIEQGVAIGLFHRSLIASASTNIYHTSLFGSRAEKYEMLMQHTLLAQRQLNPSSPYYFFVKREETHREEYEALIPVTSVFQVWSTGVQTSRDSFAIAPTRQELEKRLEEFLAPSIADKHLKSVYGLKEMNFWRIAEVRRNFRRVAHPNSYIKTIDYRPFDTQHVVYHEMIIHRPKAKVMRHMLAGKNLALLLPRQLAGENFHHALCTQNMAEMCMISTKTTEQNNLFPLYLYDEDGSLTFSTMRTKKRRISRSSNFTTDFLRTLAGLLKLNIGSDNNTPDGLIPEDIFYYSTLYKLRELRLHSRLHPVAFRENPRENWLSQAYELSS